MKRHSLALFGLVALSALALAAPATAAPINMDPGSVTIESILGIGGDFTLDYDGGDTSDNILNFTASGSGGIFFDPTIPSAALTAIVFAGTTIIDSGDTIGGGFLNPDNVVNGLAIPGTGIAAGLLLDSGLPSAESFFLQLDATPTMATIYSLNIDLASVDLSQLSQDYVVELLKNSITEQSVKFTVAIPEPSAALAFCVGLLVTGRAMRRR